MASDSGRTSFVECWTGVKVMIPILLGHKESMGSEAIKITGTNGHDLTARILPVGGSELAIFLPGLTYRNDRAGLHYPQLMMRSRGVDVMAANYTYDGNVTFQSLPEAEQLEWIGSDGRAILQAALDRGNCQRLTVIGKSLGTIAMGWAIPRCALPAHTRLVWLTPAVVDTGLEERMNTLYQPSLIVIGTLDPGYSRDFVDRQRGLGRTVLVLEGVDHGLECPGDAIASSIAITTLLQELATWLDETDQTF